MGFIKVLRVTMKLNHLHIRTMIKQRLLNKYGLRFLKVKKQEFYGKIFQLVGMQIRLDYETGWLMQLAQNTKIIFDIGCNMGQTAVLFDAFSQANKIYLFDPNPYALAVCAENAILNDFSDKIRLYNRCVSDAGGLSDNVQNGKTGWVVPKRSPQYLSYKIIEIISIDNAELVQIRTNSIRRVKKYFNLEIQKKEFNKFYQDNI